MKLTKKTLTIRGVKYEVCELLAKDLKSLWKIEDGEAKMTQDDLFALSVHVKGKAIGLEAADNLPAGVYMKLLPLVSEVNMGLFGGEGND